MRTPARFYRHLCLKNVTKGEDFISEFGFRISELFVKGQRSEDKGQGSGGLKSKVKGQKTMDNGQWTMDNGFRYLDIQTFRCSDIWKIC